MRLGEPNIVALSFILETASALADLLHRPPKLTVSEWADANRVLSSQFASEPGPFRTARTPYMRDIMDSFCDPDVSWITFVKSARVGGSEALNNMVLYAVDHSPGPGLYVLPTQDAAKDEIKGRLRQMVEDCKRVADRRAPGADWATLDGLKFTSMRLWMAWAASPVTLTRRTCRYVFFDELDNCERAAGALGNHLALAAERTTTYGYKGKVVSDTTPSTPEAAAWKNWESSDKRRYHVPCPLCGAYQVLRFDLIKLKAEHLGERDPDIIEAGECAEYECDACHKRIGESERAWMVERGVWVPAAQAIVEPLPLEDADAVERAALHGADALRPKINGDKPITRRIGFHIWSAYSPWRTWSMILAEFFRTRHDPERFKVFKNSWLGEPWEETVEQVKVDSLLQKRLLGLPRDIVPDECMALIGGVDVQKDCLYYVIRGWGRRRTSWLIREGVVAGFEDLMHIMLTRYKRQSSDEYLSPLCLAVDTGYRTYEVYEFAKAAAGIYAVKGQADSNFKFKPTKIEYTPNGKQSKQSLVLYHVNTPHYKEMIYRLAQVDLDDIGAWHLHRKTTDSYCEQFTSEHQKWEVTGSGNARKRRLVWRPKTLAARNHFLDCEVYAAALADFRGLMTLDQEQQPEQKPSHTEERETMDRQWGKGPMGWQRDRNPRRR